MYLIKHPQSNIFFKMEVLQREIDVSTTQRDSTHFFSQFSMGQANKINKDTKILNKSDLTDTYRQL